MDSQAGNNTNRLTLVISSLGAGGAERVLSTMANWWAEQGKEITLITLSNRQLDFYSLHPKVRRVALHLTRPSRNPLDALLMNFVRFRAMRRAIRDSKPDAVISFMDVTNVMVLIATRGLGVPVVVSERIDPRRYVIGWFWNTMRRLVYRWADALVIQTEALREWGATHLASARVRVIPNPLDTDKLSALPERAPGSRQIYAMGRLTHQKGFDLLLRAFARVAPDADGWTLTILGEGELRVELQSLTGTLGIADRVDFPGKVSDPEQKLAQGEIFVLSSRYEGFPNALVEAMSCGLAVISTDCPTGPAEILTHGEDGLLTAPDDISALAGALQELMSDPGRRRSLGEKAMEVRERFAVRRVMNLWDELLKACVAGTR